MFDSYALAYVLFAAVYIFRTKQFPWALQWLGAISYSVYLLHYPTWLVVTKLGMPNHGLVWGPIWILTVFVATCLVSSVTYLYVEKPAISLGKRFLPTVRKDAVGAHAAP